MAKSPEYQYFWQEFEDIENTKEEEEDEESSKTPDEGELEAEWLTNAGYGFVVSKYQAGKELSEDEVHALTEELPSNHAEVVRRRVDTLNATLRKKQKYTTKIDVRNIFPQQPNVDGNENKQPLRPSTLPRGLKLGSNGEHLPVKKSPAPQIPKSKLYEVTESSIDLSRIDKIDLDSLVRQNDPFHYAPHSENNNEFTEKQQQNTSRQREELLCLSHFDAPDLLNRNQESHSLNNEKTANQIDNGKKINQVQISNPVSLHHTDDPSNMGQNVHQVCLNRQINPAYVSKKNSPTNDKLHPIDPCSKYSPDVSIEQIPKQEAIKFSGSSDQCKVAAVEIEPRSFQQAMYESKASPPSSHSRKLYDQCDPNNPGQHSDLWSCTSNGQFDFHFSAQQLLQDSNQKENKPIHENKYRTCSKVSHVMRDSLTIDFSHLDQHTSDLDTTSEDLCDLQGHDLQRSQSKESVDSLTGPRVSKSSSCDTLDSIDSGLESESMNGGDKLSPVMSLGKPSVPASPDNSCSIVSLDKPPGIASPDKLSTVSSFDNPGPLASLVQTSSLLFLDKSGLQSCLHRNVTHQGEGQSVQASDKETSKQRLRDVEQFLHIEMTIDQKSSTYPGPNNPFDATKGRKFSTGQQFSKVKVNRKNSLKFKLSPVRSKVRPLSLQVKDSPRSPELKTSPDFVTEGRRNSRGPLEVSPRSPTTNKYVNAIIIEIPRSPTSPRGEVVHPEWASNRARPARRQGSLLKNKGGYSMSGVSEEVQDNLQEGVETLSVQAKGSSQHKRSSQLSPISDADITFEFSIEEHGGDLSPQTGRNFAHRQSMKDDSLPNFSLVPDKLGLTTVDDISNTDLQYLKNLALLELTSMFDTHNIQFTRRRTKKRHKEHGVFGVPLQTIKENDERVTEHGNPPRIPLVFQEILSYLTKTCLETEGILRVPGSTGRVKTLRQELEDRFYAGTFVWGPEVTPNDVAALMKQFLRDLPVPLLTDEYIDAFAQVENLPDKKQQLHALNLLVLLLPNVHRDTLSALLEFLILIIQHCDTNKMTINNVAMIMAPNLFMAPKIKSSNPAKHKGSWDVEIKMATRTSNIMKMLLRYKDILWTVPSYLIALVRRQYELEQLRKNKETKGKMKFLAKKQDKTEVYKKPAVKHETDFQDGVIRIQAPKLTKSSTAIQLENHTTAGDIVAKFKVIQGSDTVDHGGGQVSSSNSHHIYNDPRNFHSAGDDMFLFEIGGNIGERCLPHNTNMLALYKANPNAEWILKKRDRLKIV